MSNNGTVLLEDARIIFRNFEGRAGKYNKKGERSFCALLDDSIAEILGIDGWNIKTLKGREPEDPEQPYVHVSLEFEIRPPKIVMITSKGRTTLTEDEVEVLDWVDIDKTDLILRPYEWAVNGSTGIKAYLKTLFITIAEDALELKYADLDELPSRSGRVIE